MPKYARMRRQEHQYIKQICKDIGLILQDFSSCKLGEYEIKRSCYFGCMCDTPPKYYIEIKKSRKTIVKVIFNGSMGWGYGLTGVFIRDRDIHLIPIVKSLLIEYAEERKRQLQIKKSAEDKRMAALLKL